MGTQLPLPKKGTEIPIFGPCLLWPNGCMDQDATWHGGRPRPGPHCARWGPSSPPQKGPQAPNFRPIFGLLCPNGCMDQDATWHEGRPRPRPHCARWGPMSPPPKEHSRHPQFLVHICCCQMARWIKMPLGRKLSLDPSDIVLDGDPAPLPKRGQSPNFRPMSIVAKWLHGSRCHLVWG